MSAKFIVIEGLDGSGKATQTKILFDKISAMGKSIKRLEFPDYANESSALVKMYLGGEFGSNPNDVNAYAASSFYAVDRVASFLKFWKKDYDNSDVILSDRYATSNIIYQMSKLDKSEWDNFIEWQEDFEYNKLSVPKPDKVIYLDVKPEVSQKLMSKRYEGDEGKKIYTKRISRFCLNAENLLYMPLKNAVGQLLTVVKTVKSSR